MTVGAGHKVRSTCLGGQDRAREELCLRTVSNMQVRKSKITKHFRSKLQKQSLALTLVWLGMGHYTVETFSNKYLLVLILNIFMLCLYLHIYINCAFTFLYLANNRRIHIIPKFLHIHFCTWLYLHFQFIIVPLLW